MIPNTMKPISGTIGQELFVSHSPHRTIVEKIDYSRAFSVLRLLDTFRMAVQPGKLLLALLMVIVISLGGLLMDAVVGGHVLGGEFGAYQRSKHVDAFLQWRDKARLSHNAKLKNILDAAGIPAEQATPIVEGRHWDQAIKAVSAHFDTMLLQDDEQLGRQRAMVVQLRDEHLSQLDTFKPRGVFATALRETMTAFSNFALAAVQFRWGFSQLGPDGLLEPNSAIGSLRTLFVTLPTWLWHGHWHYLGGFMVLTLLACSLIGGAISRQAVLETATQVHASAGDSLRYTLDRSGTYLFAPIIPLIIAGFFALMMSLAGMVFYGAPILDAIGGLLFVFGLAGGFVVTFMLVLWIGGVHLVYPALGAEGTDALDAVSRSFSYVLARPLRMIGYSFFSIVYGAATYLFVGLFIFVTLWLTHLLVGAWVTRETEIGMSFFSSIFPQPEFGKTIYKPEFAQLSASGKIAAVLTMAWVYIVIGIIPAFAMSFYFSSYGVIYLLMRRSCDGTDITEVFESNLPGTGNVSGADTAASDTESRDESDHAEQAAWKSAFNRTSATQVPRTTGPGPSSSQTNIAAMQSTPTQASPRAVETDSQSSDSAASTPNEEQSDEEPGKPASSPFANRLHQITQGMPLGEAPQAPSTEQDSSETPDTPDDEVSVPNEPSADSDDDQPADSPVNANPEDGEEHEGTDGTSDEPLIRESEADQEPTDDQNEPFALEENQTEQEAELPAYEESEPLTEQPVDVSDQAVAEEPAIESDDLDDQMEPEAAVTDEEVEDEASDEPANDASPTEQESVPEEPASDSTPEHLIDDSDTSESEVVDVAPEPNSSSTTSLEEADEPAEEQTELDESTGDLPETPDDTPTDDSQAEVQDTAIEDADQPESTGPEVDKLPEHPVAADTDNDSVDFESNTEPVDDSDAPTDESATSDATDVDDDAGADADGVEADSQPTPSPYYTPAESELPASDSGSDEAAVTSHDTTQSTPAEDHVYIPEEVVEIEPDLFDQDSNPLEVMDLAASDEAETATTDTPSDSPEEIEGHQVIHEPEVIETPDDSEPDSSEPESSDDAYPDDASTTPAEPAEPEVADLENQAVTISNYDRPDAEYADIEADEADLRTLDVDSIGEIKPVLSQWDGLSQSPGPDDDPMTYPTSDPHDMLDQPEEESIDNESDLLFELEETTISPSHDEPIANDSPPGVQPDDESIDDYRSGNEHDPMDDDDSTPPSAPRVAPWGR